MTRSRIFQGLCVRVEENVPTPRGEGVRITLPDGSRVLAAPTRDHPTLDAATCYAVNKWRVDKWAESGHGGVI